MFRYSAITALVFIFVMPCWHAGKSEFHAFAFATLGAVPLCDCMTEENLLSQSRKSMKLMLRIMGIYRID